jgi:hypothetical protein
MPLIIGLWTEKGDLAQAKQRIDAAGAAWVTTTLVDAIEQVRQAALRPAVMAAKAG